MPTFFNCKNVASTQNLLREHKCISSAFKSLQWASSSGLWQPAAALSTKRFAQAIRRARAVSDKPWNQQSQEIRPGSDPGSWAYSPEWFGMSSCSILKGRRFMASEYSVTGCAFFHLLITLATALSIQSYHGPLKAMQTRLFCMTSELYLLSAGTQGGNWGRDTGEVAFEQQSHHGNGLVRPS